MAAFKYIFSIWLFSQLANAKHIDLFASRNVDTACFFLAFFVSFFAIAFVFMMSLAIVVARCINNINRDVPNIREMYIQMNVAREFKLHEIPEMQPDEQKRNEELSSK